MISTERAEAALKHEEPHIIASREFGFWLFLLGDAITFALLIASYAVLGDNSAAGPTSQEVFHLGLTLAQTVLLLLATYVMGLAVVSLMEEDAAQVRLWLAATVVLGLAFTVLQVYEFSSMIASGAGPDVSGFLSAFFTLLGVHGLHVIFGTLACAVLFGQVIVKGLTKPVGSRVIRMAVYWHFLVAVWVAIYSVVYLSGVL
ncbi:cytochrome o ubiquinol oxidase subunit III [Roseibium sp. RKSG952]|nr:cytochrome o ubiquinol oxidase subunit III [Roseibium sp. RKSG952]